MVFPFYSRKRNLVAFIILVFILFSLIITIYVSQQSQEIRKKAADQILTVQAVRENLLDIDSRDYSQVQKAEENLLRNPDLSVPFLINNLNTSTSIQSKGESIFLLGKSKSIQAIESLENVLLGTNSYLKKNALIALGEIKNLESFSAIIPVLRDPSEDVRREAALTLGKLQNQEAVDPLISFLSSEKNQSVKEAVVFSLGILNNNKASSILITELNYPKNGKNYKDLIIKSMQRVNDPSFLPILEKYLSLVESTIQSLTLSKDILAKGDYQRTKQLLIETISIIEKN